MKNQVCVMSIGAYLLMLSLFMSPAARGQTLDTARKAGSQGVPFTDLLVYAAEHPLDYENILALCEEYELHTLSNHVSILKIKAKACYNKWKATADADAGLKAENYWREAIKKEPKDVGARALLAMFYYDANRFDEADALVAEIMQIDPNSPHLDLLKSYCQTAMMQQELSMSTKGDSLLASYRAKIRSLSQAISNSPSPALYLEMGNMFWKLYRAGEQEFHTEAINAWLSAVDMDAKNIEAMSKLVGAYLELKKYNEAREWVVKTAKINPAIALSNLDHIIKVKTNVVERLEKRITESQDLAIRQTLKQEIGRVTAEIDAIRKLRSEAVGPGTPL